MIAPRLTRLLTEPAVRAGGRAAAAVRAFTTADIATWLDTAGMNLEDLTGPARALLFTARRRP